MRIRLQLVLDVTRNRPPAADDAVGTVAERDVELGSIVELADPHPISLRAPDVRPDPFGYDRA